jgi:hypothetical protein
VAQLFFKHRCNRMVGILCSPKSSKSVLQSGLVSLLSSQRPNEELFHSVHTLK